MAEDAVQLVFIDLARRASGLRADERLGGWLHQRAMRAASTLMRGENRRRARELRAAEEAETETGDDTVPVYSLNAPESGASSWQDLAPYLDQALQCLSAKDRDAVLLRCVEGRNLRAVGGALGLSDDAAQKRVSRALEKLRAILLRRRGGGVPAVSVSAIMAGLDADHAKALTMSGGPAMARVASAAMTEAAVPLTWAARWLPQGKAAAAGSALACVAWAWPLMREYQALHRPAAVQTTPAADKAPDPAPEIRFPVFPPLPKLEEGLSVEEIVRRIAALAAGPYNDIISRRFYDFSRELGDGDRAAEAVERIADDFPPVLLETMNQRHWRIELLKRWARKDLIAALDHILTRIPLYGSKGPLDDNSSNGFMLDAMWELLFEGHADLDLSALSNWYASRMVTSPALQKGMRQRNAVRQIGQRIVSMALSGYAEDGLRTLISVENQQRLGLLDSITGNVRDTRALELITSLVPDLGTPALRAKVMNEVMSRHALVDYEGARRLVEAVPDPEQRLAWAGLVGNTHLGVTGARFPSAAAQACTDWWLSMAPPEHRESVVERIGWIWMQSDPAGGVQWLERQLAPNVFLKHLRNQVGGLMMGLNWKDYLPTITACADRLRKLDPQGAQTLFDQVDEQGIRFSHEALKIRTLLPP
ncbi:MAG: sigma-70 family RNA polymerase sigma factor [Verrucomicrobiaceae bacterium]|nr:MAG: sigma-70 family RNA polymerase sigma factor [Verrucomicrobiaceae bacterium]